MEEEGLCYVEAIMKPPHGYIVESIGPFHFISLNEQKPAKNISHKIVDINEVSISN